MSLALGARTPLGRLGLSRCLFGVSSSLSVCTCRFGGDRPRASSVVSAVPTGFRLMPPVLAADAGLLYALSRMFLASGCGTLCVFGGYSLRYVISGAFGRGTGDLVLAFMTGGDKGGAYCGGGGLSDSESRSIRLGADSEVNFKLSMDLLIIDVVGAVVALCTSR